MFKKPAPYVASPKTATAAKKRLLTVKSPFAIKEAYNAIRTKLMFTGKGEKCPVFAVTSSMTHDGKTTNAVNLSISIAFAGKKVLLIDGDMRKPTVYRYFNVDNANGLSEILAGLTNEVHIRKTDVENLHILTSGLVPPNPAELFSSKQMDTLLEYVKKYFDFVIIDTPPINIVTDAATIAEKVTGYVYVVQSGKNHLYEVSYGLAAIQEMGGSVVGIVMNDPTGKAASRFGYRKDRGYVNRRGYSRGRNGYGYGGYGYGGYGYGGYGYGGYGYGSYGYGGVPYGNYGQQPEPNGSKTGREHKNNTVE